MVDQTPAVCSGVLLELQVISPVLTPASEVLEGPLGHTDEVLHVSFSNAGDKFVSCSKDGVFIVWGLDR